MATCQLWLLSTRNVAAMKENLDFNIYFRLTAHDKWCYHVRQCKRQRQQTTVRNFYNLALDAAGQGLKPFRNALASTVGMHRVTTDPCTLEACSLHCLPPLSPGHRAALCRAVAGPEARAQVTDRWQEGMHARHILSGSGSGGRASGQAASSSRDDIS